MESTPVSVLATDSHRTWRSMFGRFPGASWISSLRSQVVPLALAAIGLAGCAPLQIYKAAVPLPGDTSECSAMPARPPAADIAPCLDQATERNELYALHIVEFDDEGWPFAPKDDRLSQVDSAIDQIKAQLRNSADCVRLFVYIHGWRHNAEPQDLNLQRFRELLATISARSKSSAAANEDACEDPILAGANRLQESEPKTRAAKPGAGSARLARTVGIFVGWRGLSISDIEPFVYASFWDRKNTADRVSQGSVRELFGRLSGLATYAPAVVGRKTAQAKTTAQLRTYVIAHSFGASIAFRALSQSLIDSFAEDLESDDSAELASVSRFVDMLVLVNPAIEAARFDPVFRAAQKRVAYCKRNAGPAALCDQPLYQAPVLAIFTSEGDQATKVAFPLGAALSTTFETTVNEAQRRSIVQTIGWDDNYKTHRLYPAPSCSSADENPFTEAGDGRLRYRPVGWTWCFKEQAIALPLSLRSEPTSIYNGPLWNVRVSADVMRNHSDIWNDLFSSILLRLFSDQR